MIDFKQRITTRECFLKECWRLVRWLLRNQGKLIFYFLLFFVHLLFFPTSSWLSINHCSWLVYYSPFSLIWKEMLSKMNEESDYQTFTFPINKLMGLVKGYIMAFGVIFMQGNLVTVWRFWGQLWRSYKHHQGGEKALSSLQRGKLQLKCTWICLSFAINPRSHVTHGNLKATSFRQP